MKITILAILFLIATAEVNAQIIAPKTADEDINEVTSKTQFEKPILIADSNITCNDPDVMPEFVGGNHALHLYLRTAIVFPAQAKKDRVNGRVVASFILNKYGRPQQIKIVKSLSLECDAEVVRVIKAMPAWKPASKDAIPVGVYYTLPVAFNFNKL